MNNIQSALFTLVKVHELFALTGSFKKGARSDGRWPVHLPCSPETQFLYDHYDPSDVIFETGYTPINMFSLDKLEEAQAGYRWVGDLAQKELNPHWSKEHLVLMDGSGGGKPIIAISGQLSTPIYALYDVAAPFKIADSLADFVLSLAKLIEVVYGEYDIFDIADDDDNILPEFVTRIRAEIIPVLGHENFERFYDYFYG